MGLPAVGSLQNMEYLLYPTGSGFNAACPSYANGYQASINYYDNAYGYGYNNPFYNYALQNQTANQAAASAYNQPQTASSQLYQDSASDRITQASNQALSQGQAADANTLGNYFVKASTVKQNWSGLPMSAAMIGFMECPQTFKHFINAGKAIKVTNQVFDMSNSAVKSLWESNPELMQKAYGQLHAINRSAQSKWPILQKWFSKPIEESTRANLENIMKDGLEKAAKGDTKALVEATETLKASRGMDGYLPTAWKKIKCWFKGQEYKAATPMDRIAAKSEQIQAAVNAPAAVKPGAIGLLKDGIKQGKAFAIFGLVLDSPKIISAFQNGGVGSGIKQITQTGTRSLIDGIGWTVGSAVGKAVGTKVGAAIGTAICPGIGTAIGAALGFIGGAAGSILASKIGHWLMPTDEATKLEAEKKKQTAQGQAELVQFVAQKAQSGEEVPAEVLNAANNVYTRLSA